MRILTRKILLSIVTVLFVFGTMVATTYAWVGILTYSGTQDFDINLKVENLDKDYSLIISPDGKKFDEGVYLVDIQRQILKNRFDKNNFIDFDKDNSEKINKFFNDNASLSPLTTDSNLSKFYSMDLLSNNFKLVESKDYYKFDLYISVNPKDGKIDGKSINTSIFLANLSNVIEKSLVTGNFIDGNPNKDKLESPYDILNSIPNTFTMDARNAARIALEIYNPVKMDDYTNSGNLYKRVIYQGGSTIPSYDSNENVYDLGGILPENHNTAIKEINSLKKNFNLKTPKEALERGDLDLVKENSLLFESPKQISGLNYLGIQNGIQTKVKITVYFWFEGWDADCLMNINQKPVSLNLTFSSSYLEK